MRKALVAAVSETGTSSTNTTTLDALLAKGLFAPDGTLTDLGRVSAVSLLPLHSQCRILGLPLSERKVGVREKPPELMLMNTYLAAGVPCCYTEGGVVFVMLYALCFDRLLTLGNAKWGRSRYTATMAGKTRTPVQSWMYSSVIVYQEFLQMAPNLEAELVDDIATTSVRQAMKNFEVLRSWQTGDNWFPHSYVGLTAEFFHAALEGIPRAVLVEIARLFFADPHAYVKGWPDLALVERGLLRFVEVKTTDRLHASQVITMGEMRRAAGVPVSVERMFA